MTRYNGPMGVRSKKLEEVNQELIKPILTVLRRKGKAVQILEIAEELDGDGVITLTDEMRQYHDHPTLKSIAEVTLAICAAGKLPFTG